MPPFNSLTSAAENGRWWIDLQKVDEAITKSMYGVTFGQSIDEFHFGFELAEMKEWRETFRHTASYVSYRPSKKTIVSVGQFDWDKVKLKTPQEQLLELGSKIRLAALRVALKKRKPKDFRYSDFAAFVQVAVEQIPVDSVTAPEET